MVKLELCIQLTFNICIFKFIKIYKPQKNLKNALIGFSRCIELDLKHKQINDGGGGMSNVGGQ